MIMWISWSAYHLTRATDPLYFYRVVAPTLTDEKPDPAILERASSNFGQHAATLDKYLGRISYADFRVATPLPFAEGAELPLSEFPNVRRWHDQLCDIEAWRDPFHGLA
jgi:glutathione S-transferase